MSQKNSQVVTQPAVYNFLLPKNIKQWLYGKGITEKTVNDNLLGWHLSWKSLTIPIFNKEKNLLFYKYRQNPLEPNKGGAKYWYDSGVKSSLYGIHFPLTNNSPYVVFCEGELDALVLLSNNIPSITSTGGAGSFRKEWLDYLNKFNLIYICFDNDKPGFKGSIKLHEKLPNSTIVQLPKEVGEKGDISDYFSKLKHTTEDFLNLLKSYKISNTIFINTKRKKPTPTKTVSVHHLTQHNENIDKLKEANEVPIILVAETLGIQVKHSSNPPMAKCPFHNDSTPSLAFYPTGFYCFGCKEMGNSIELVKKIKNCTFPEAIKYILSI